MKPFDGFHNRPEVFTSQTWQNILNGKDREELAYSSPEKFMLCASGRICWIELNGYPVFVGLSESVIHYYHSEFVGVESYENQDTFFVGVSQKLPK